MISQPRSDSLKLIIYSSAPAEKVNPSRMPSSYVSHMMPPDSSACTIKRYGATNRKANSTGSVTPVTNAVSAATLNCLAVFGFKSSRASWMIAKAMAGRANMMTG